MHADQAGHGMPHPTASIASIRACVPARYGFHYPRHSAVPHPSSSCKQPHNVAPQAVYGEGQRSHPENSAWQEPLPLGAGAIFVRGVEVVGTLLKLWLLHQNKHISTGSVHNHASSSSSTVQDTYSATVQQLISDLGPLWVKLGQTLAVRPDVVGNQLAGALSGLQESAPPFPSDTAAAILQEELGAPPHEVFARWSGRPVASASLGQVYQAELADGRLVAVKVQRPGTWAQITLDLSILTQLLHLLRWAGRIKQDITQWATTLGQGLAQELDYRQEAHNVTEFAAAHSYLGFVGTPHVIWPLTTTRVLTTTWVEGQTPGQILRCLRSSTSRIAGAARKSCIDSKSPNSTTAEDAALQQQLLLLVDLGIQATLHQLVVTGVLHADPHPGNLLLSDGKLVFLDFGLVLRIPEESSMAMMAALLHWSQANWLGLAADMRQMGLLKPSTDLHELATDLQLRFERLYASSIQQSSDDDRGSIAGSTNGSASTLLARAGAIGFAEFAGVVAALALKYRFELPPYYTLVIRSLTTLEGFALVVDPSARYSIARTAVKVVARQLLYDKRPAARELLQQVLVLQGASGAPVARRLNLQLLEELLQLSAQQTSRTAAAGNARRSQAGAPTSSAWQAVDPVAFCQEQLGLPIQLVAAQLNSSEAASVRATLAQQLVSRLLDRRVPEDVLNTNPQVPCLGMSPVASTADECGTTGPVAGRKCETRRTALASDVHAGGQSRSAPPKAKTMHGWLAVLVGAGVGGVKLAAQLGCLVLGMLLTRAVVWIQQRIRQLLQWVV